MDEQDKRDFEAMFRQHVDEAVAALDTILSEQPATAAAAAPAGGTHNGR